MKKHQIRVEGPRASGPAVSAGLLHGVLGIVLEGSKRAIRMRAEGRSSARGPTPGWIEAATDYSVEIKAGSTVLELEAPTLIEAAPDTFEQADFFSEIDPTHTGFDYFAESLEAAAVETDAQSHLYDKGLLEVFKTLESVFDAGAERLSIDNGRPIRIEYRDVRKLVELESQIPAPQQVRLAGRLDSIRHSDQMFTVLSTVANQRVKGVAEPRARSALQELWGDAVVVSGTAHFTPSGEILRIDAEHIRSASEHEESLWGQIPRPLSRAQPAAGLRVEQGPRSGLNAILGRWPGDESDEEVIAVLGEIS